MKKPKTRFKSVTFRPADDIRKMVDAAWDALGKGPVSEVINESLRRSMPEVLREWKVKRTSALRRLGEVLGNGE